MNTNVQTSENAIYNFASLLLLSAKDKTLKVEFKPKMKIGKLDDGEDADDLLDKMMGEFGVRMEEEKIRPIPHINDTPIPLAIFAEVMKCLGELYLKEKSELTLKKL